MLLDTLVIRLENSMKPYSVKKLSEVATISSVRKGGVYSKGSTLVQISASNGESSKF